MKWWRIKEAHASQLMTPQTFLSASVRRGWVTRQIFTSLLLATLVITLTLALAAHHLAKHHHAVAIHEGNTGEALAILEGVADQWLLWLEAALSHLIGLQGVRVLHLLATSLLAHLPLQGGHTACCTAASHKANGGVAHLDLVGDIQHLDLSIELLGLAQGGVLLVDHHVTRAGHVVLVKTLDVQAHIVARIGEVHTLVGASPRWRPCQCKGWRQCG